MRYAGLALDQLRTNPSLHVRKKGTRTSTKTLCTTLSTPAHPPPPRHPTPERPHFASRYPPALPSSNLSPCSHQTCPRHAFTSALLATFLGACSGAAVTEQAVPDPYDYSLSVSLRLGDARADVYLHCRNGPQHPAAGRVAFGVPTESIPGVQDEVAAIAELAQTERGAETFIGEAATLSAFFTRAPHAGVLHLATHGVYRPDNPIFSGLRLVDGWLTARDLYTLGLRAAPVILSACESALSGQGVGDEQFGLARGFLHAGAPALVASRWLVKDEQTTLLIRALYTRLYSGESVGRALRGAPRYAAATPTPTTGPPSPSSATPNVPLSALS